MKRVYLTLFSLLLTVCGGCVSGKLDYGGTFVQGQANNRTSWFVVGDTKRVTTVQDAGQSETITRKIYICTEPTPRVAQDIKDALVTAVSAAQHVATAGADVSGQAQFSRNLQIASVVISDPTEISGLRELLYGLCQLSVNINSVGDAESKKALITLYGNLIEKSADLLKRTPPPTGTSGASNGDPQQSASKQNGSDSPNSAQRSSATALPTPTVPSTPPEKDAGATPISIPAPAAIPAPTSTAAGNAPAGPVTPK